MPITYDPITNYAAKDALPTNDPDKVVRGTEFSADFDSISSAFALAASADNAVLTGTTSITNASVVNNIVVGGTVDGRDVAADGTKLDNIEALADVTDTANVTAAGALMDSELTNIAAVKALNQGVATTDSPTFAGATLTTADINGGTIDGTVIGGSSAAAGTFTTGQFNTSLNVDGTATIDGLTVNGDTVIDSTGATPLVIERSGGTDANTSIHYAQSTYNTYVGTGVSGAFVVGNASNLGGSRRFAVEANNDISFYDATGSSKSLFWDASEESLGIGVVPPSNKLSVAETQNSVASLISTAGYAATFNSTTGGTTGASQGILLSGTNANSRGVALIAEAQSTGNNHDFIIATSAAGASPTEKMRVLDTGNVGIGTSTPSSTLEVAGTATMGSAFVKQAYNGITRLHVQNYDAGVSAAAQMYLEANGNNFYVTTHGDGTATPNLTEFKSTAGGSAFAFSTANTERMRVTTTGNIGIGTSSPASLVAGGSSPVLSIGGTDTALTTGDKAGSLSFITNDTSYTPTYSDGITGEIASVSESAVGGAYGLAFYTGTTTGSNRAERMRIDSAGNVLFGRSDSTNPAGDTDGNGGAMAWWENANDGFLAVSRNNSASDAIVASFNRTNGDGKSLSLNKNGAQVGSIGTVGGDSFIGTGVAGLRFFDYSSAVLPHNTSTNVSSNGVVDLGVSSNRFKDLHLSGGVYLGGTGSANKLDDYEEGTWTPSVTGSTSGSAPLTILDAVYTKVGNTVHAYCYISADFAADNIVGTVQVAGLPFATTVSNLQNVGITFCDLSTTYPTISGRVITNLVRLQQNTSIGELDRTDCVSSAARRIMLGITYRTAA